MAASINISNALYRFFYFQPFSFKLIIYKMSIEKIKELFSKRIEETDTVCTTISPEEEKEVFDENEEHGVLETDVGITEFLNDSKGFMGLIKQRYSDFHVHEIDPDGNIVYMTSLDIPILEEEPVNFEAIPEESWQKLEMLADRQIDVVEIDVTGFDKEKRREIHQAIKKKYGTLFNSNTTEKDSRKLVQITVSKGSDSRRPAFRKDQEYLHFTLFKRNLDMFNAVGILASMLKIKTSRVTFAGTKDKRAVTSQRACIRFMNANQLKNLNKRLKLMMVGNFAYRDAPIKLGEAKGNMFEIALRNVTENDNVISEALGRVKENGFLNYFGVQRFGNYIEALTPLIGQALIKEEYKKAVELILKPRKDHFGESDALKQAKETWWKNRNAEEALKHYNSNKKIEGVLLLGLAKNGKNAYKNALDQLAPNVRNFYCHSYQSLIWNKVLSKRIQLYKKSILEGDLVFDNPETNTVRHLSLGEVANYTIYDVIHPIPGYAIVYPNNIIKSWYEEFLKDDNLTLESFKMKDKSYSQPGFYRNIAKKLKDFTWDILYYTDPDADLILSDVDKMNNVVLSVNKDSNQEYKAVVLKFSLDTSTYATMALREMLKVDTSTCSQKLLDPKCAKRMLESDEGDVKKKQKTR